MRGPHGHGSRKSRQTKLGLGVQGNGICEGRYEQTVFVCFFLPTFGISGNSDRKQLSEDCVVGLVF